MLKHHNATATEHLDASLLSSFNTGLEGLQRSQESFNAEAPAIPCWQR
jgi:hypothetical protein